MGLTFATPNTTHASYAPIVKFGTETNQLHTTIDGVTADDHECGVLGPKMHYVNLTGLEPNTKYYYKFGKRGKLSEEMNFVSAPKPGHNETVSRFAIYGDMGVEYSSNSIMVCVVYVCLCLGVWNCVSPNVLYHADLGETS